MQDNLISCPRCESPYCYQKVTDVYIESNCMYCGFMTSSHLLEGSEGLKAYQSNLPKFYQDIKFLDSEGFNWIPRYYEVPGKGRLYANLMITGEWVWAYEPFIEVPLSEREMNKNPDGSYQMYKADEDNAQYFQQHQYVLGLIALGVFM